MKKTVLKLISIVLSLSIIAGCMMLSTFAEVTEADGKAPFRISVVMNGDASSQRGICWYTAENTSSVVEITDESGVPVNAQVEYEDVFEWEGNFVHKAVVSGLEAGKTYYYTVGDGTVTSNMGSFKTDDGDSSFKFLAIADVQAGNLENFEKSSRVVDAAMDMVPDAEFVVNLGDMTDDSTNEEWDWYDQTIGTQLHSTTVVPTAGNHDGLGVEYWFNNMFNLDTSESVQVKDGVNYSYDYGNAHIAVLNTNDLLAMSIPQMNWLKNDMNSTDKDWKIVFMHKSPYSLGKDAKWPDALYLQKSIASVFDACDVDIVMSGHDHMYLRTNAIENNSLADEGEGTVYVLAGTAGAKRYEVRSFLADIFLDTDFIGAMTVQKDGYGNYWDGEDWDQSLDTNIGGVFNSVSIEGGTLTYKAYVVADEADENGEPVVTEIDSFTITKEVGQNEITFTGDNTTSEAEYNLAIVPSFLGLAAYAICEWLPKFLIMLPSLLYVVITEDTF